MYPNTFLLIIDGSGLNLLKIYVHTDSTAPVQPYHFLALTMITIDFIRKRVLSINIGKSSKIYAISRFS